jgi:ligand-binding sensor domain-containing protein
MRLYSGADGLASDDVSALLADSRGFLWIGGSAGLSRFDGTTFKTFIRSDGLPHVVVNSLLEDRAGRIWIGTRAGLARIEQQRGGMSLVDLGPHTTGDIGPLLQSRDGSI